MIQFNLLPEVKLQYVKATRLKHMVSAISVLAAGAALFIMVVLFLIVVVIQRTHMNNLNSQITTITSDLKNTPNLNKILTVQSQVNALPALDSQKPVTSRLPGFIAELTPSGATIGLLNVNLLTNVISITGAADSLATVNQYVDTIKFSTYQTSPDSNAKNTFSNVVLSAFGYTTATGATYTITASFDPLIFSGAYSTITLNVPSSDVSHSSSNSANVPALFQSQSSSSSTKSNGSTGN